MSICRSKQPVPRHLLGPPTKHKQTREDANVPPRHSLVKALLPGAYGNDVIPPRLEFGCRINDDRMLRIAEKLGCLAMPEDYKRHPLSILHLVMTELWYKLDGMDMKAESVFIGIPGKGGDEDSEYTDIYSFCTSHDLSKFPSKENVTKLLEILGVKGSDLKWWVSEEVWYWRRADLKKEARERMIAEYLLYREWEDVLAGIDARQRMRKEMADARRRQQGREKDWFGNCSLM